MEAATAYDRPALGGVYKLGALRSSDGNWQPKLKLSEQAVKIPIPGILQVRRYTDERGMMGDMIYDEITGADERGIIVDVKDPTRRKKLVRHARISDLLTPAVRKGKIVAEAEDVAATRARVLDQLGRLHPTIRRFMNPHEYPIWARYWAT